MARFFIFIKILSLVNAYYQRLDFYYYFSIVRALQNSKNFSNLLLTQSSLKVCNDQATTARSCCFGFFNANFELTRVHYCYIFWSGSLFAKNLPKVNGRKIIVASPSAALRSFLQNLERILAYCSQLYINCLAIFFLQKPVQNRHLKRLHSIVYIVLLSFLPALRTLLLSDVFDILACGWVVLCMVLKRVHIWLRCCSHVA